MKRVFLGFAAALVVVIGGITLASIGFEPNTAIPAGFAGSHVRVNGVLLRVLQEGSGPDVLLIHGSPGSLEDWDPIRRALQGHARVTSYDRPNNGFSAETGDYSLAHNADFALDVIEALDLDDVTVVGHSYGGSTALAMALRAPERVSSYVILDSATYTPGRPPTLFFHLLDLPGFGTGFARLFSERLAGPRIAEGIPKEFRREQPTKEFVDLRVQIWSSPKVTRSIAAETIGSARFLAAQSAGYSAIRQPVRIVAQAEDPFRRETAERLHREVAGSTLRPLPGTGHFVQLEKPDEVVEEIRAAMPM
jgi:pimeloyl-ACP methyl ester carboxylesterase